MADQQPEALKHAEWLERSLTIGAPEAAAELRRLHEREEGLQTQVDLLTASVEWRGRENATLRAHVERLQAGGQVAAPAMVPLSKVEAEDLARADVHDDIDWTDESNLFATAPQRAAFRRGLRAAEQHHGINGLTVGGIQAGGAHE